MDNRKFLKLGNSVTPQWQVEHKNPTCGETVDVLDPTDVNIVFSP